MRISITRVRIHIPVHFNDKFSELARGPGNNESAVGGIGRENPFQFALQRTSDAILRRIRAAAASSSVIKRFLRVEHRYPFLHQRPRVLPEIDRVLADLFPAPQKHSDNPSGFGTQIETAFFRFEPQRGIQPHKADP